MTTPGSLNSIIHSHPLKSVVDKIWFKYRKVSFYAVSFFRFVCVCVCVFVCDDFRLHGMAYVIRGHPCLVLGASRKWLYCHAISHLYGLITLVIYSRCWLVPLSTALTSVINMREKCKSTPPSKKSTKDNRYWREISRSKPTWKRWANCWLMQYRWIHS